MQDQPLLLCQRTVVDDMAVQNDRVRNDDFLVLDGPQVRYQQADLGDVTDLLADLDPIADLEGATVRHRMAGDDIGYERRRSERENHAEENRYRLEGFGAGARYVGVGHYQCQRDHEQANKAIGRQRPFPVETRDPHAPLGQAGEKQSCDSQQVAGDEEQDDQEYEVGQGGDDTFADDAQRIDKGR